MKPYNEKRVEKLFAELREFGYIESHLFKWSAGDIDSCAQDAGVKLPEMTDDKKVELLSEIIEGISESVIEDMNDAICIELFERFKTE